MGKRGSGTVRKSMLALGSAMWVVPVRWRAALAKVGRDWVEMVGEAEEEATAEGPAAAAMGGGGQATV